LAGGFWSDARLDASAIDTSIVDVSIAIEWRSDIVDSRCGAISER
jgi:hypothetical protein